MGSVPASLPSDLLFLAAVERSPIGPHEIYRLNQEPYGYLVKFERRHLHRELASAEFFLLKELASKEHLALAKPHQVALEEEKLMCAQHTKITQWFNYYNFTLRQAIRRKKALAQEFKEGELWYLLQTLIDFALFLEQQGLHFGNYNLDQVFLSPDGLVKLYIHEFLPGDMHNSFHRAEQGEQVGCLAPQVIERLHTRKLSFSVSKADLFSLSLTALCAAFMIEDSQFYSQNKLLKQELESRVKALGTKVSDRLQIFMTYALELNPDRRITFRQAHNFITNIRDKGTEVCRLIKLKIEQTESKQNYRSQQVGSLSRPLENKFSSVPKQAVSVRPVRLPSQLDKRKVSQPGN